MKNVNDNYFQINKEIISKAKLCTSPEALQTLVEENGLDINKEQAAEIFNKLQDTNRELADEELDIAGGGCFDTVDPPNYNPHCPTCGSQDNDPWIEDGEFRICHKCGNMFDVLAL